MKTKILFIIMLITGGAVLGQNEGENDTTRFKIGNYQFIVVGSDTTEVNDLDEDDEKEKAGKDLTYWSGFELGVNLPVNGSFQNEFNSQHLEIDPSQSFVYHFNFFEKRIRIIGDYVGLVTGLGFTNSRYGFKNENLRLGSNSDSTFGVIDTNLFNGFSKNQLRVNTFNIPLLLQINTSKKQSKNFHIAVGAVGGIRIGSNVKYNFDTEGGGDNKNKERGRFNLNPFQLSGTVRVGYNDFGLFANYNILSLYERDKSEEAFPLSFGASFHF